MKRSRHPSSPDALPADVLSAPQLDLFPVRPIVEQLVPKSVAGAGTAVTAVLRVRLAPLGSPHLVFLDRHGWYCEAHGASCPAVLAARGTVEPMKRESTGDRAQSAARRRA